MTDEKKLLLAPNESPRSWTLLEQSGERLTADEPDIQRERQIGYELGHRDGRECERRKFYRDVVRAYDSGNIGLFIQAARGLLAREDKR